MHTDNELTNPEHFRRARERLGLTQAELARLLGYGSKSRIAELEAGARKPGRTVVRLLGAYLAGFRPTDWPTREALPTAAIAPATVVALPATRAAIEAVSNAMRNGARKPGEISRATGLGLLTVNEALEAIRRIPTAPPKRHVPQPKAKAPVTVTRDPPREKVY